VQGVSSVDYQTLFVPFGPRWGAEEVDRLLTSREIRLRELHLPIPWIHGFDAKQVVDLALLSGERAPAAMRSVSAKIEWVVENPGTQLTGSFNPTNENLYGSAFLKTW
jgi:hypothetical protein